MKKVIPTLLAFLLFFSFNQSVFATSIGKSLPLPEEGWIRFDDTAPELVYSLDQWVPIDNSGTDYNRTVLGAKHKKKSEIKFKFEGTKIRLIINSSNSYTSKVGVSIDGVTEYFSARNETGWKHNILSYEKTGLDVGLHEIVIWTEEPSPNVVVYDYRLDAIDVDGKLVDYETEVPTAPIEKPEQPPVDPVPQPSGDRAILVITYITGLEKEYDLSMDEVNSFIDWYDNKDVGIGPSKFAINKHNNNKGPFKRRTDYVIFNNILTFEVNEYSL
ncbi:bacterial surface protein [Paenibacillus faecalis]|uniref:bacterial surface protein n=1 Tax=Paenibacillus faecalis TaxID=2079532 RepID=UPI000D0F4C4A|nr:bacterial surface protein [Paenibacillus faecalis]